MSPVDYSFGSIQKLRARNKGALWTKAVIKEANELYATLANRKPGDEYKVKDVVNDEERTLTIPALPHGNQFIIRLTCDTELSAHIHDNEKTVDQDPKVRCLYYVDSVQISAHRRPKAYTVVGEPWDHWKQIWKDGGWERSDGYCWGRTAQEQEPKVVYHFRKWDPKELEEKRKVGDIWKSMSHRLVELVTEHSARLTNIDRIICFGLGNMTYEKPRSFIQHAAAATIRDALNALHPHTPPIEVLAQDPEHCDKCRDILAKTLNIETVSNLRGLFEITPNTLVIAMSTSARIRSIIADLTLEHGGPPAMLYNVIGDQWLEPQIKPESTDLVADPDTEALVAYKNHCIVEAFGDVELLRGMTNREWYAKNIPYVAEMKHAPEGTYSAEDKDEAQLLHSAQFQVNFPDLKFYFKKD
ncbi:hypothetical protein BDV95DRAFT_610886 [Massariosphaeria phaeospora]|uniref:SRR1-like domain-containing protein n=1 Tax=Massariosphaeria phaeospora TaxID=100035 RepID=A0A7C8I0K8_9PLEO|nr:hypothetical protein BDV95DRAFT_610886 [Massariosphaeria phaeospora]